jgi:hypothetical protein
MSFDDFDISWFKDLTDIVKNKTMFFLPCFGPFLAFVFKQSEYIKGTNESAGDNRVHRSHHIIQGGTKGSVNGAG